MTFFRLILSALVGSTLVACGDDVIHRRDAQDIDVVAHGRVLATDRPTIECRAVEFHFVVVTDVTALTTLPSTAWAYTLGPDDAGMRAMVPNECFGLIEADGGAPYYRTCFSGLTPGQGYFLGISVDTPSGLISQTTFFRTASCGTDGGMDARTDATDVMPDAASTDVVSDIVSPDALDVSDSGADDVSDASMDGGEIG